MSSILSLLSEYIWPSNDSNTFLWEDFQSTFHTDPTPLHTAVIKGSVGFKEVESLLSDPACDVNARYYGKTPLQFALDQQDSALVGLLLSHGARLSANDILYYEPPDLGWASQESWYQEMCSALRSKRLPYTHSDISRVVSLLTSQFDRFGLIEPDIIHDIIDLAEFWTLSTRVTQREVRISQDTPPQPYVESAPIRGRGQHPVQRIVFTLVSHDQGWGGEGLPGLYAGSWSWFEVTSSSNPQPVEVQRNATASRSWRTHVIIWDKHSPTHIVEWLAGLKPGDVVSLYPKAMYPGWENHVAYAELHIYTSFV